MNSLDTFNFLSSQAGLECAEDFSTLGKNPQSPNGSTNSRLKNFRPVISEAVMSGGKRISAVKNPSNLKL